MAVNLVLSTFHIDTYLSNRVAIVSRLKILPESFKKSWANYRQVSQHVPLDLDLPKSNVDCAVLLPLPVDADDNESYYRGCAKSSEHDDEEDKCVSFDKWGEEHHECVCDESKCNGGTTVHVSAAIVVSAVLGKMLH